MIASQSHPHHFQRAAKHGAEALKTPEDTFDWTIELMDAALRRVDAAVDEGNKALERHTPQALKASQVSLKSFCQF